VDGEPLEISGNLLALVVLNIPSYGGGSDLWGQKLKSRFSKQLINDKIFEVVGVKGAFHFGQIQSGMAQGIRLKQGSSIQITTIAEIDAQIDGEPFKISPSQITVTLHNQAKLLLNSNKDKCGLQLKKLVEPETTRQILMKQVKSLQNEYPGYTVRDLVFLEECIDNIDRPEQLERIYNERLRYLKEKLQSSKYNSTTSTKHNTKNPNK